MSHHERDHSTDEPELVPAVPSAQVPSAQVPSAQVPDGWVEANDGQRPAAADSDAPYVDGNLDPRGDIRAGRLQHDPTAPDVSLDDDLDTSPRTDGQGNPPR